MHSFLPLPAGWRQPLSPDGMHDTWRLHDGTPVILRPARHDDGSLIQQMMRCLSMESRYHRFFYPLHELTPDMLERFTHNDPRHAMTLLVVTRHNGTETAIAMAQYVVNAGSEHADFAVVVADAWQRKGLAKTMIQALICIARAAGLERFEGDILAENEPMLRLMLKLDFAITSHPDGSYLRKAWKRLETPEWTCSPMAALGRQAGREGVDSGFAMQ